MSNHPSIGKILEIYCYPFKSMKGQKLTQAQVTPTGILGDRVYALVDPQKPKTFPWLSARQIAEMILFEPIWIDFEKLSLKIKTPENQYLNAGDPDFLDFLKKRWNREFEMRFDASGMHDSRPISVFSKATLQTLNDELGIDHSQLRFRPNLYVEWEDPMPFFEETLLNRTIQIGHEVQLLIDKKDSRCTIINLEPKDALANPAVLKNIGQNHGGQAGVYATVHKTGTIRSGDPIFLLPN